MRPGTRRLRVLVELLVIALVVQLVVVPQIGGARAALHTISALSAPLLVVALACEAASIVAYGALTRSLLPAEQRPGLATSSAIAVASMGINHVVPGGAATTAAVNYRLFGLAGVEAPALAYALVAEAVGSAVVLNVMLWLALLVSIPINGFHRIYGVAAGAGAVVMLLFALGTVALVRGNRRFARLVARPIGRIVRTDPDALQASIEHAGRELVVLLTDRRRVTRVVGLAMANWLLDATSLWVCLVAFGHRPSAIGVFIAYGLANVAAVVPITPGGLGVIEAVLIPTLVGFGTPASVVAVGVVVYRLMGFWLPIPVGGLAYLLVERHLSSTRPEGFRPVIEDLLASREGGGDDGDSATDDR